MAHAYNLQPKLFFFLSQLMQPFIRFSDLCAQGKVAGQRVFIRADLNVPQDEQGSIT